MSETLKPCPFCGGYPQTIHRGDAWGVKCTCSGKRFVHTYGNSEEIAVASWNARFGSSAPTGEAEGREVERDWRWIGPALQARMDNLDMSVRDAAADIGCSHSTVSRIARGDAPDIDNYFLVANWLRPLSAEPRHTASARRWRHKKRGTTYTEIGRGKIQAEHWRDPDVDADYDSQRVDMREVVTYRADEDGSLWVRPVEEFEDGRFEEIAALSAQSSTSAKGVPSRSEAVVTAERAGIYTASKTKHARLWRSFRDDEEYPINSTWIDEAGEGESGDLSDLWVRCITEARTARVLVVYREPDDVLKGAWTEMGAALAAGVPVYGIGIEDFTIANHPGVTHFPGLADAMVAARTLATTPTSQSIEGSSR